MKKEKLSPEELLRAIDELPEEPPPEEDDDIARIAAMSPAEIQSALEAEGYTKAKLEQQAEAILGRRGGAPATVRRKEPAKVIPLRPRASHLFARVAAAAVVLGPASLLALSEIGEGLTMVASAPDAGEERLEAAVLRSEAADALEAGQWAKCIARLDEAKRKDPKGDEAQGVKDVRRIAMSKLGVVDGSRK
jgi:hypothetical protein